MKTVQKSNKNLFDPPHPGGFRGGGGWGSTFQKSGKFHELPRKSIICFTHPPPMGVAVGILGGQKIRGENVKVTKHQVFKSISGMRLSCAIITLQIFWAKPGNPREGG